MLQPSWRGRRVSVRRAVGVRADGRPQLSDVVGELTELDERWAVVVGRRGRVEVDLATVAAARLVGASSADELDLQRVTAGALRPTHSTQLDGWTLRADPGSPRRANSVLTAGQLDRPLDDALDEVVGWYAAHGRAALIQVPDHARRLLDGDLAARGWTVEAPAAVLTAPLSPLVGPQRTGIELTAVPDDDWLALHGGSRDLLVRHDTVTFASARIDGVPAAVARGTVDEGLLGLTGMFVDAAFRRRGLAAALVAALAGWGRDHAATQAYLQVEADNLAARALYERLGFLPHHAYHYRRGPTPLSDTVTVPANAPPSSIE